MIAFQDNNGSSPVKVILTISPALAPLPLRQVLFDIIETGFSVGLVLSNVTSERSVVVLIPSAGLPRISVNPILNVTMPSVSPSTII